MLAVLGGVVAYAYFHSSPKKTYTSIPQTVASTGAATQDSNSSVLGADTMQNGISLQSNLGGADGSSSGSSSNSSSGSSTAAKIPGPSEFGQYEQYKDKEEALFSDLVVGTGTEVAVNTKVAVTYQGWLTNGTLFDQSHTNDKGQVEAFTFVVGAHSVIPGWEQAIIGMKVGGKRRFVIPPVVGYGAEGHDPIPPNAVLIFDVNLVDAL